ncbi:MAG: hypothetical protein K9N09_02145 [Candidatus Cloacimonetes bacterium]|nr:hypothetical protein [Candidatus Cloacimonadota bacterium]MCF7813400.1 hypothetical protein [Candidatus Cloacimonadota bacterium]MCF7867475.1 hypothetical protein [Candidatus Cloacimonadota bacterium]MCF7883021.1 hypothetical protein [Candidatus Cloacimonadota bacterium]
MLFRKFKIVLVICSILFLLSCTKSTEPTDQTVFQPLNISDFWDFYFSTNDSVLRYSVEEKLDLQVDGELKEVSRIKMANLNYYQFNDDDGLHAVRKLQSTTGQDSLLDYSYLLYKFPVELDETWIQDLDNDGFTTGDNTVKCVSKDYLINYDGENLHCLVYKTYSPDLSDNYVLSYFCPGIGLIKQTIFDLENNSIQEKYLVEYELN